MTDQPAGIEDLTVREVKAIERQMRTPIDKLADPGAMKGDLMQAMAWIIGRRADPDFTWEQAEDAPISQIMPGGSVDPPVLDGPSPTPDSSPTSAD